MAYFDVQARSCVQMGSPLYGALVERLAEDLEAGGVVAELLQDWQGNPISEGLAMRFLGAVHHLVLSDQLPELAEHYPSTGGTPRYPAVADLFVSALEIHRAFVAKRLKEQVQTNEVRRSAALLGGFLAIASATRRPLRLLEIGASAGLNQLWDRYRYELGPHRWGDPAARPVLQTEWRGEAPALDAPVEIESRHACDLYPVDLSDAESRCRLAAFIWPDQPDRRERFDLAADAVVAAGVRIEQGSALRWLEAELSRPASGVVRVVFHSVMWLYVDAAERAAIKALMSRLGDASGVDTPLAWLRMEGRNFDHCELRLRLWPGGGDELLGTCGFHGQHVDWVGR
jgi:hypothetical protein